MLASSNIDGLVSRNRKFVVHQWIKKLSSLITILGVQEIKTSSFLTSVALNIILPDYPRIVSLPEESRGDTTLLFHPSSKLINSGTLELGRTV